MKIEEKNEKTDIEMWKEEHKKIFKSIIDGKEYIWRRGKRKEYSEVMNITDIADADDRIYARQVGICKATILNIPMEELEEDLEDLSGLAVTLSEEIMEKSGFNITATFEM